MIPLSRNSGLVARTQYRVAICGALLSCLFCAQFAGTCFSIEPQRREADLASIISEWKSREAALNEVSVRWTEQLSIAKHSNSFTASDGKRKPFPESDTRHAIKCSLELSGEKYRLWTDGPKRVAVLGDYARREYTVAFNGKDNRTLLSGGPEFYPCGFINTLSNRSDMAGVHLLPLTLLCRPFDPALSDLGLGKLTTFTLLPQAAILKGVPCRMLRNHDNSREVTIWVMDQPAFLPLQVACSIGEQPVYEVEWSYRDDSVRSLQSFAYKGFTSKNGANTKLLRNGVGTLTALDIGPVPSSQFELEFPVNTWVVDSTDPKLPEYILKSDGSKRIIQDHERRLDITYKWYKILCSTDTGTAMDAREPGQHWLSVLICVGIAISVVAILCAHRFASR